MKKYYTVNEAAAILSVHRRTIIRYIRTGLLAAIKLKSEYRIPVEAVDEIQPVKPNNVLDNGDRIC